MEKLGNTWLTDKVKEALRNYFDNISKNIAITISKSEVKNDNVADEEFITKELIKTINDYSKSEDYKKLKRLIFNETGAHFNIKGKVNDKRKEFIDGADLGIILNVKTQRFNLEKSFIAQSKKGKYDRGHLVYPEFKKRGKKQIKKMQSVTKASCLFFYNPSNILNIDLYEPIIIDYIKKIKKSILQESIGLKPDIFSLKGIEAEKYIGILVCPTDSLVSNKEIDPSFEMLLPLCKNFSEFMVDYFFACFFGDSKKSICLKAGTDENKYEEIITKAFLKISLSENHLYDDGDDDDCYEERIKRHIDLS